LGSISTEAIIGICLGVGNAILPMHDINSLLFPEKGEIEEHSPIEIVESGFLTVNLIYNIKGLPKRKSSNCRNCKTII
jgi:hypothetical protein